MEITLNITHIGVRRLLNLLVSICFIIYGTICCYFMAYLNTRNSTTIEIVFKIISTIFGALFALTTLFINMFVYRRKIDSDIGYYLASGFGIGAGVAIECCALLVYPLSTLFFWAFAVGPIIIFAVNTAICSAICKSNVKREQHSFRPTKLFITSFIICIGLNIALLIYFLIAGLRFNYFFLIPILAIAPIIMLSVINFTISIIKKKQTTLTYILVGLSWGLSWIIEFSIFLDYSIFNMGVSLTVFILGFLGIAIYCISLIFNCVAATKTSENNNL